MAYISWLGLLNGWLQKPSVFAFQNQYVYSFVTLLQYLLSQSQNPFMSTICAWRIVDIFLITSQIPSWILLGIEKVVLTGLNVVKEKKGVFLVYDS